jgi:hypothetical protein
MLGIDDFFVIKLSIQDIPINENFGQDEHSQRNEDSHDCIKFTLLHESSRCI